MNITELTAFDEKPILELYSSVGWINYTNNKEMLKSAFENSLLVLGAYEDEKLVGSLRAVGDGVSVVFIQDILVLPEYQHKGIGTRLIQTLKSKLPNVYQIELLTDNRPDTVSFYKSNGFSKADEIGCCAFIISNR